MSEREMNLGAFYRDDHTGEFNVAVSVRGTVRLTIEAADASDARAQVEAMLDKGEVELFGSDIDVADIDYVRPHPPMYLVNRNGREMGVSHVQPGDEPCAPTSAYMASRYLPPEAA